MSRAELVNGEGDVAVVDLSLSCLEQLIVLLLGLGFGVTHFRFLLLIDLCGCVRNDCRKWIR
jgi:hypothetical protein